MNKDNSDNTKFENNKVKRTGRFIRESSIMDVSGKFSDISLQKSAFRIGKSIADKLFIKEHAEQKQRSKQEFLLNLMPEIFHDVRSPFISIIGFAGIFKQKAHSENEIAEYSKEIIEESYSALKRLEALEHLFSLFLDMESRKLEKLDIFEIIEWIFTLLHVKISRKKLKIVKKIDKNLKICEFMTYAGNLKLLLFELFCRLIVETGNKSTIILQGVWEDNQIVLSMIAGTDENMIEENRIKIPSNFQPAFEMEGVITKVLPGQGFMSIIRQESSIKIEEN